MPETVCTYMAQNIGTRKEQQDSFLYSDIYDDFGKRIGAIGILTDGMGGLSNGKIAGKIGAEEFFKHYTKVFDGNINSAIVKSLYHSNAAVQQIENSGTTIVGAVIENWNLYWFSVGDSRLYLMRNGLLRKLNIENNYANTLKKQAYRGEITFTEALNNPKRSALTSYLGIDQLTEFDYNDCQFPLICNDCIVLCTDGLYRTLSDAEMARILSETQSNPAEALLSSALYKGKPFQDNITVMVLKVL